MKVKNYLKVPSKKNRKKANRSYFRIIWAMQIATDKQELINPDNCTIHSIKHFQNDVKIILNTLTSRGIEELSKQNKSFRAGIEAYNELF